MLSIYIDNKYPIPLYTIHDTIEPYYSGAHKVNEGELNKTSNERRWVFTTTIQAITRSDEDYMLANLLIS